MNIIKKIINDRREFYDMKKRIYELQFANLYHDAIAGCKWMPENGLGICPSGWAVGYPYLYIVFRILNDINPTNILECGIGQSTRLIGQYAKAFHDKSEIQFLIVEQDQGWIDTFQKNFEISKKTEIMHLDVHKSNVITNGITQKNEAERYISFKEALKGRKFDFISIDAPHGEVWEDYSRVDILDILPDCLMDKFCIVMDDYDQRGEQNTVELIKRILDDNKIPYFMNVYTAVKQMAVIASADFFFMKYI